MAKDPTKALGHYEFLNDYGQMLEVKHVPGHDFLEVWVGDEWMAFKRSDKKAVAALAEYLLAWTTNA